MNASISAVPAEPTGVVPVWDLADRLVKAMKNAGLSPGEMATYLGVSSGTITNWTSGKVRPKPHALRDWARRTGVDYAWLVNGGTPVTDPTGPGIGSEPTVTKRQLAPGDDLVRPRRRREMALVDSSDWVTLQSTTTMRGRAA